MAVDFLRPVVALVLWTFVMWTWMYATRIPAIRRARMKLDANLPKGEQMESLPPSVRWKADNYNHLFEQPTVFYAVAVAFAVFVAKDPVDVDFDVALAWAYVGARVVHSVFQATINKIEVRFAFFVIASMILLALTVRLGLHLI
jgi:hypothetical protein